MHFSSLNLIFLFFFSEYFQFFFNIENEVDIGEHPSYLCIILGSSFAPWPSNVNSTFACLYLQ